MVVVMVAVAQPNVTVAEAKVVAVIKAVAWR
jgi:hypothetical protein